VRTSPGASSASPTAGVASSASRPAASSASSGAELRALLNAGPPSPAEARLLAVVVVVRWVQEVRQRFMQACISRKGHRECFPLCSNRSLVNTLCSLPNTSKLHYTSLDTGYAPY
jgi:hypothetical protein